MDVDEEFLTAAANAANGGDTTPVRRLYSVQLDLEAYAARYTGRTRVSRLLFIADSCGSEPMETEALRMAYDESRGSECAALHRVVSARIAGRLGPLYALDQDWADAVDSRALLRLKALEGELHGHMITNLIKEGTRMCFNELGDLYHVLGQLPDALDNYAKTHEYATTSEHILQTFMNVILVSIELGEFTHVLHYVIKAEQTADNLDHITVAKLQAAAGLAYLATKDYKFAAWKFIETGLEIGDNVSKVIAPQDVAVCGGLCAVASFDRSELKLLCVMYGGYLEELKPNLLLDIHMHEHVEALYKEIRHKAIIHYTLLLYLLISTQWLAFKTSVFLLEKELAALITENKKTGSNRLPQQDSVCSRY